MDTVIIPWKVTLTIEAEIVLYHVGSDVIELPYATVDKTVIKKCADELIACRRGLCQTDDATLRIYTILMEIRESIHTILITPYNERTHDTCMTFCYEYMLIDLESS